MLKLRAAPNVTALSVSVGSTGGGTTVKLTGTELHSGASVTFGTVTVVSNSYDPRDEPGTSLLITTRAHAAGVVDLIVTNPNQVSSRITGGYEYASQQSFDFNGEWDGVTNDGSDVLLQFTIRSNVVRASCQGTGKATVALATDVVNGDFSSRAGDTLSLSGRIVSSSQAIGSITAPSCTSGTSTWQATKLVR